MGVNQVKREKVFLDAVRRLILFQLPTFMNAIVNLFLMLLPKKMSERYFIIGSDKTKLVSVAQFH